MSDEPTLPEGPILVVSPHLHDAVLSCAAFVERSEPVTVLDVFTVGPEPDLASEWDRRCGFDSGQAATIEREREEAEAFMGTSHEVLATDLLDGRYLSVARGRSDERRLRTAIDDWTRRWSASTVVLPAGAGVHVGLAPSVLTRVRTNVGGPRAAVADPDHLWVRDTALEALRARDDVDLWLYEELPQRFSRRGDTAVDLVARWTDRTARRVDVAIDRRRKADRLATYGSQIGPLLGGDGARPSRLARRVPGNERYWSLHA
jgi:LmbE family N-acetylglucosaminyl deacetylase